ncbi:MAG: hypothetical protein AAEJ04_08860 [Planctomycetota bacterium]
MRYWTPLLLMLFLFSGCIVVQSDATRVDEETGALHVDLRSGEDAPEDDSQGTDDDSADAESDSKIAEMREKVEAQERKLEETETKMEIAEMERDLAAEARDHQREAQQRALAEAKHDLEMFHEFGRAEMVHNAERGLAFSMSSLSDAQAELEQLTILYEGSELEDGTDELVLERGRRSLERAEEGLAQQRRDHRQALEISIPKQERELERSVGEAERTAGRGERESRIAEMRAELEHAEMERDLDEIREELEELQHDLREMTGDLSEPDPVAWLVF